MKRIILATGLTILLSATTASLFAQPGGRGNGNGNSYGYGYGNGNGNEHGHNSGRPTVGAPLDGGLLALLGAAGTALYVSRKKKQNS